MIRSVAKSRSVERDGRAALRVCRLVAAALLVGGTLAAEPVRFLASSPGVELAGELRVPPGEGPFPAAVLLTVAGPNDRDQSVGPHRGFAELADRLAEAGIASLRWDDRGVGESTGEYFQATYDDLAADALAAIDYLSERPEVASGRIGVIGNSEGGAIGPLAASRSDRVAFVVLLAGPGIEGHETIRGQLERAIQLQRIPKETARQLRELYARFLEIQSVPTPDAAVRAAMVEFLAGGGQGLFPPYAFVPREVEPLADFLLSPWYRSQLAYDPAPVFREVRVPVLALVGDKDAVLPEMPHLESLRRLLAERRDATLAVLPDVNHLFQTALTGSPLEYATLEEAFSTAVASRIARWILDLPN